MDTPEQSEPQKAVKKKVIIKSKQTKKETSDFDFSHYGGRRQGRIYAMMALYRYDINEGDVDIEDLFNFEYEDRKIHESVYNHAKNIIEGVLKNIGVIDENIIKFSTNWDIKRIQHVDKAILRMSIYSLMFQDDVPRSVVIDEAIEIAKIFSKKESYKFINGILDGIK